MNLLLLLSVGFMSFFLSLQSSSRFRHLWLLSGKKNKQLISQPGDLFKVTPTVAVFHWSYFYKWWIRSHARHSYYLHWHFMAWCTYCMCNKLNKGKQTCTCTDPVSGTPGPAEWRLSGSFSSPHLELHWSLCGQTPAGGNIELPELLVWADSMLRLLQVQQLQGLLLLLPHLLLLLLL